MITMLPVLAAASLVQSVAPSAPPAPIIGGPHARRLQAWLPGEVRCDGRPVAAISWRRPYLAYAWANPQTVEVTYRFELDQTGRPLDIKLVAPGFAPFGDDIGPSLAASRFRVEGARADCIVSYSARFSDPADTPVEDVVSYTMAPSQGQLPREWWGGIFPASATCDDEPPPMPLTQSFPDPARVPGTPGVRDWAMFAYDTDTKGQPINIRLLTGTRNAVLDREGAAALARSRYTAGPRTGCRMPYVRMAEIMPAPPVPAYAQLGLAEPPAGCKGEWANKPPLSYPQNYRRRSIEGWAIIGYDLAPWGGTGNVRVLAAQPAAEFGERAAALIRAATRQPSSTGVTGCVERVRFVMGRPGIDPETSMTVD
jgi:TonB family protein